MLWRAGGLWWRIKAMADGADTRGVSLQEAGRRDARRASAKNRLKL